MTTPQEREQEIREREQAATSGPWESSDEPGGGIRICHVEGGLCVCCLGLMGDYDYENSRWSQGTLTQWQADASFVSTARDDVPYLLARVAQLEAALEAAKVRGVDHGGYLIGVIHADIHNSAIDAALATMPEL